MKLAGTLIFALLVGGCVTNNEDDMAYLAPWSDCIRAAAARLDDGKSDPTSIALGITSACAAQYNTFREHMVGKNITQNGQAAARIMARDMEIRLATTAVLYQRATTRRPSP